VKKGVLNIKCTTCPGKKLGVCGKCTLKKYVEARRVE